MAFALVLTPASTVDDLADHITRSVWSRITATPALERLYPGYFVAIHSVILRHLSQQCTTVRRGADGNRCLVHEGAGDAASFQLELAVAIVGRLDEVLRRARAAELIQRGIPDAVAGAMTECGCASRTVPVPVAIQAPAAA